MDTEAEETLDRRLEEGAQMSSTTKVAAAVAAGYLLGRTKKLRLAITVGSMLAGGRLAGDIQPGALLKGLSGNPELERLTDQLRGQVLRAAKSAAVNVTTSRLEALNESLLNRGSDDEEEPEDQESEDEYDDQADDQADDQSERPRRAGRTAAKTASRTAKKTASRSSERTGATKAAASKTGSAKRTASKTAAKKTPTAKRTASKASGSGSGSGTGSGSSGRRRPAKKSAARASER